MMQMPQIVPIKAPSTANDCFLMARNAMIVQNINDVQKAEILNGSILPVIARMGNGSKQSILDRRYVSSIEYRQSELELDVQVNTGIAREF